VVGWIVKNISVDPGISTDILFASTFDSMKPDRNLLQLDDHPLYGFGGKQVMAISKISIPVTFGDQNNSITEHITFDVVDI
jgi:hypothetical protein